jgi:hypothetical protein
MRASAVAETLLHTPSALTHEPTETRSQRQLRGELCGVWGELDDEVGVQCDGDPVQERDGGDDAAGFEAGQCGLSHAGSAGEFDLGKAEGEAPFADGADEQVGALRLLRNTVSRMIRRPGASQWVMRGCWAGRWNLSSRTFP